MPGFVLLEHAWNGLHWDLMLEAADGAVLHTWAIDEPVVAGRDLPARRLADHRPLYLDHEGPVSNDRGTVRRLDRGTYHPIAWSNDAVEVELRGAQLVGRVWLRAVSTGGGTAPPGWLVRFGKRD